MNARILPIHPDPRVMEKITNRSVKAMEGFIFWSRWLQAPLYIGLIIAQGVYVYQFMVELSHLVGKVGSLTDTDVMLIVLGLIDVVMIANLLIMVIIGGYETFVSRLDLEGHPDQPEWLSHVNAGVLKIKLSTAIISISSIHLLKTFINAANMDDRAILWQVVIHVTFLVSAVTMAWTDKIMTSSLMMAKKH
ncbi:MAG: TIGR00645 family protein [Betaproteobacteria bacterium]|nr:TIGR00645 family protein [Betaproteobacteria bacterium]